MTNLLPFGIAIQIHRDHQTPNALIVLQLFPESQQIHTYVNKEGATKRMEPRRRKLL